MKIIIYSANIGNYDDFYQPSEIDKNVKYILFTDNKKYKSNVWDTYDVSKYNLSKLHPRKIARMIKINSHLILPNHDVSIWIDHCFKSKIKNSLDLLNQIGFFDKNIMLYRHTERRCIYSEAETCIKMKLDTESIIKDQMKKYKNQNFPVNFGLFQTGFMIRKNNDSIKKLNEVWSNEILNGSGRDQLSQCYASWVTKVNIDPITIGKSQYDTPFLEPKKKHNKKHIY